MKYFVVVLLLGSLFIPVVVFGADEPVAEEGKATNAPKYFKIKVNADGTEEAPVAVDTPIIIVKDDKSTKPEKDKERE
jgi:hypothetical protein